MGTDLFMSRRGYNEECLWWSRKEKEDIPDSELVMRRTPSGSFMAREISPEIEQNMVIAGSFMFDKSSTTIKTVDDITGLKQNDLVQYQDELWIVVNVQKTKAKIQNTMYARDVDCSHYWYLELRK